MYIGAPAPGVPVAAQKDRKKKDHHHARPPQKTASPSQGGSAQEGEKAAHALPMSPGGAKGKKRKGL